MLRDVAPKEIMTLALVENLQRQDLNPIEEAEAFRQLVEQLDLTQEQVAQRVSFLAAVLVVVAWVEVRISS